MDIRVGQLLKRLEDEGLRDSTIIFFYADHGEGMPRGKTNGINYGYRVPFIVWFPEMYKHLSPWGTGGVVTDELIEFMYNQYRSNKYRLQVFLKIICYSRP